ncbi:alpha-galactosidase [Streptomyces ipomoeae]|uniref:Alpha-galactosidase n=2 Tax=Streptomyces ipomoeae TaxID=103232 RepID=L1L0K1_9ACTN|nr:glycoside hydrolase family 36 protein [Streptomyces ipomoeae]EKX66294.1 alpha-galactosidase [Streptomyces ipomoeae 91-03]MDX2697454.1 alpha-galactosidase [Streptomyces ipomoeae]MDX2846132.1 alpha-galactosidase [Streptomyces ipomoeae]TQE31088.1 alpha-galactosidase [Streptomyces ipomoeae]TQE33544.1 alpha-galactosidase [Streptomyces ipomoeae]
MPHPFTPVASVPVDLHAARVHEEGWQSWSPSGSYALGDTPYRPANDNWATVCYRPGHTVPADTFQGEGLLALDPGDGTPVRLWAAPEPTAEVPSIRLVVRDGQAEITADGPVKEWTGTDIQSVLADWAAGLALPTPRPAPTVWCSWYEYFTAVTEDDIHENLRAMDTLDLPIDVVQIDDGYQKALGDWLTLSGRFRSREGIADTIRARGRRAGIWTAPFLVDPASTLAAEHPDWLVRDTDGGFTHAGHNWGHDLYVLDTTHPEAAAYLTEVFTTLRSEGYDYFKVDFLYAGALDGVRHADVGALTAYREGIELIRAAIGPDAYLLGCGAPILPSIGLFDAMRVSPDTAPHRRPEADDHSQPGQDSAEFTGIGRQWQHGRLWVNDPDCLMARPAVETRERWAAHVESTGGLMASSDRLLSLDTWGVEMTRRLLTGVAR